MYETWMALNIAWEAGLTLGPWLPSLVVAVGATWAVALWQRPRPRWAAGLKVAAAVAAATALLVFLLLPASTGSSLAELGYWVDALVLFLISAGLGGLAGLTAWPLAALALGWRQGSGDRTPVTA